MSKALALYSFLTLALWAMPEGYFAKEERLSLAKDEYAVYEALGKPLYFRWTLYINKGLVMHYGFDGFPYQNVLYDDYKRNAYKIRLKQRLDDHGEPPYIMVVFTGMQKGNKKADFTVYVYDPLGTLNVKRK